MIMVSQELNLRAASRDDVEALASITCAAMPMDPQWDYRFPLRKRYPEDHVHCTKEMFSHILEEDGVCVNVITFSTRTGDENDLPRALAVWEVKYNSEQDYAVPDDCKHRRDANFEHMKAFDEALISAKKRYFDDTYGSHQLHLRILATHPDYQRHGAGSMLCKWGMQLAGTHQIPVTLFSSPLGQLLYSYLGFDIIGEVIVHVKGETNKLKIGAMVFKYSQGYGFPVVTNGEPSEPGVS